MQEIKVHSLHWFVQSKLNFCVFQAKPFPVSPYNYNSGYSNKCTRRVHSRLSTKKSEENDKYTWRMFRYGTVECKSQDVGFFKENDKVQPRGVKVQL